MLGSKSSFVRWGKSHFGVSISGFPFGVSMLPLPLPLLLYVVIFFFVSLWSCRKPGGQSSMEGLRIIPLLPLVCFFSWPTAGCQKPVCADASTTTAVSKTGGAGLRQKKKYSPPSRRKKQKHILRSTHTDTDLSRCKALTKTIKRILLYPTYGIAYPVLDWMLRGCGVNNTVPTVQP